VACDQIEAPGGGQLHSGACSADCSSGGGGARISEPPSGPLIDRRSGSLHSCAPHPSLAQLTIASQTITGLFVAASVLFQGCVSAPSESGPPEAEPGGATALSPASAGSVGDGPGEARVSPEASDGAGSVEGPSPAAKLDLAATPDLTAGSDRAAMEAVSARQDALAGQVPSIGPTLAQGLLGADRLEVPWASLTSSEPLRAGGSVLAGEKEPADSERATAPREMVPLTGASGAAPPRAVETADGLSMGFEVSGQGRPVVLIHGWCGNGEQWSEIAAALARSYRVYTVDLVGHGTSAGQVRSSWTIAAFGNDVARLLERERLREVVLVGHSMGGPVALEAAARAPGRVAAIVGVESLHRLTGEADPERMAPYVARFRQDFPAAMGEFTAALVRADTSPATRARIVADSVGCDAAMAVALVEHFGTYDPKPATRIIDSPVRCINADVTPTDVDGNRGLLPSFEVELLEATGHWPHLEAPERFQAALGRVLTEVAPAPEPGSEAQLLSLGPIVRCEDVAATQEFYTERLRFEELECEPGEQPRSGEAVTLVRDGATVVLQSLASLREDLPEVTLRPGPAILLLEVTNLNAELVTLGDALRIVVPERRLTSGARQVVIEDPAGSLVILRQARERL